MDSYSQTGETVDGYSFAQYLGPELDLKVDNN